MKKFFLFLGGSFATVEPVKSSIKASEILIPIGKTGTSISLLELSTIKVKDLEKLTGRELSFGDKLRIKVAQKKLRDNIAPDGTFDTKKIEKALKKQQKGGETGFHIGGFALGFLLGLIGVLIAYLINDDYKSNRVKWSWIGLLAAVALTLALYL
jgi:hypothetical protein